jgi:hypothetical protein
MIFHEFIFLVLLPVGITSATPAQDFRSSLIRAPYSISFGEVTVGKTSDPQKITVLNTANTGGLIDKITVTGDFTQTTNCPTPPASIAQNVTFGVEVAFKPMAAGPASGTVSIFHDRSPYPLTVSLTGSGTLNVSSVKASSSSLNFGEQDIGTTSKPQTITLSNAGKKTLLVSAVNLYGDDFAILMSSTCENIGALTPDSSCTVVVAFTPLKVGKRDGSLKFTDDAADSPQMVTLTGIGKQ